MSNPERWHGFPPLPSDIQDRLAKLTPFFEETGVSLAYVFGSLAQNEGGHDVDLALLCPTQPALELWGELSERLNTERLDVLDLASVSPVLRFEVISTGRLLYAQSEEICYRFEMSTLRQYKDTAWQRRHQQQILRERMKQWYSNTNPSNDV